MKSNTKIEFETMLKDSKILIVDFFATWCGPCQMYYENFKTVSRNNSNINFLTLDVDLHPEIAGSANVESIPTTVAFKNGKEVKRFSGYASEQDLTIFVNSIK